MANQDAFAVYHHLAHVVVVDAVVLVERHDFGVGAGLLVELELADAVPPGGYVDAFVGVFYDVLDAVCVDERVVAVAVGAGQAPDGPVGRVGEDAALVGDDEEAVGLAAALDAVDGRGRYAADGLRLLRVAGRVYLDAEKAVGGAHEQEPRVDGAERVVDFASELFAVEEGSDAVVGRDADEAFVLLDGPDVARVIDAHVADGRRCLADNQFAELLAVEVAERAVAVAAPEPPFGVDEQLVDKVVGQRVARKVVAKVDAVVACEAFGGGYPDVAVVVLNNAVDVVLRQPRRIVVFRQVKSLSPCHLDGHDGHQAQQALQFFHCSDNRLLTL